jgi:hypothetical protein
VRTVPVTVADLPRGVDTVEIVSWSPREVLVRPGGPPMRLTFARLPPAGLCEVALDDRVTELAVDGAGALAVTVPEGTVTVRVRVR